jgi:hypothetical protein
VRGPRPLAERPYLLAGAAPGDPALARDLARTAAQNARSTWCVTVTDAFVLAAIAVLRSAADELAGPEAGLSLAAGRALDG